MGLYEWLAITFWVALAVMGVTALLMVVSAVTDDDGQLHCPRCSSTYLRAGSEHGLWLCRLCGHVFNQWEAEK